jgi:hypothetical protein
MTTPKIQPGSEHAKYLGATAMVHLRVFPGKILGLYRCAVYEWFDRMPLYASGTDRPSEEAKIEAEREAARLVGYAGADVNWRTVPFRTEEI